MYLNVKFEFLYRDAGNHKQYGSIVFTNSAGVPISLINKIITEHLIDGLYFYPEKLSLPNIRIHSYNPELDLDWYEFDGCTETEESPGDKRDINEFLEVFKINDFGL